jgi:hypothetical protein
LDLNYNEVSQWEKAKVEAKVQEENLAQRAILRERVAITTLQRRENN